ncbi:hypothetical protein TVAG_464080 [Trichomonas vaginalis G3]|uniref:Uncharacterized protein n=1 Tax=Trichomonas vaginalis (strain ATCC PRA-98 / G3) TaxID=412133 RepID=A2E260_TRIV3|nr:hypothetical protein TVAGG3_1048770 [Trichomonas vaginalis G3]EAY13274.1 hypothetical protein TVAG_464080 [Trichomonas vaginalis G3]KAI5494070.1 hypothetical protein TVAGG3_1048770 [Trichomonas vaginalis G3]|eukprot:XP_001325497.1 hypothetical protein [Trichomonas vaginalis G3]
MFSILFSLAYSFGGLDIRYVMQGFWLGNVSDPQKSELSYKQFRLNVTNIEKSNASHLILIDTETNKTVKHYQAIFQSKSAFQIFEGNRQIAQIELAPFIEPPSSCSGKWEDTKLFNFVVANGQAINLHIFDPSNKEWKFFSFYKDVDAMDLEPNSWGDTLFGWGFLGVTMLLAYLVSARVQKCVHNQTLKKAMQLLKEEEEQDKTKKKKKKNE